MHRIPGEHTAQMSLAEDQHPVGDFAADGQDKALGEAVRPRTAWWDLDHLDTGVCQDRVERRRELTGAIADEEPEPGGAVAEVRDEVAGLLGGPGSVGMSGDAQDVEVAVADLEHEQDVEPSQGERAVDVEEVDGEHAGGLGAQELPPAGVGAPDRCRWDAVALEDPPDCRGADTVAEFEQLTLDPQVAPARFSRAIRTTKATRLSSVGGRPARFG
jgi:hypothetical protein